MVGKGKGSPSTGSGRTGWGDRGDAAGAGPGQRYRHDGFTAVRQRAFLKTLSETGCVRDACRVAGISSTAVYRWRRRLPDFAARWETALAMAGTELEAVAWKRAVEGTEVVTIRNGEVVSITRKPSDALLRLLMQGANPLKYGRTGGGQVSQKLREEIKREVQWEEYQRREAEAPAAIAKFQAMLGDMHERMRVEGDEGAA